jgi:hypothetical protein
LFGGAKPAFFHLNLALEPMANDERRSETFIREVDEELRREQLQTLWNRFGWIFIGICVLIVLITAGYRGWIWWQERQAAQAGDRFLAALEQIQGGNREEGEAALQAIAEEGGAGYAALARLRLAGESAASGDKETAIADYDALAADGSLSQSIRDLARIRAALLALDTGDTQGAIERAKPLDEAGNPWRHVARNVLGTAAYQAGNLEEARGYFLAIQQDAETPPTMWLRAGMMISLIDGQLPEAGSASSAPAAQDEASADAVPEEKGGTADGAGMLPQADSAPSTQLDIPPDAMPAMDLGTAPDAAPVTEHATEPAMGAPDAASQDTAPEAGTDAPTNPALDAKQDQ